MAIEQITVPDFGDVQEITVVDVYVKPGDKVEVEDPLVALELSLIHISEPTRLQ